MAPKSLKKVINNEDRVKTGSILNKDGFLQQYNNLETTKKIIKAFTNNGLLKFVTFEFGWVHEKEIVEFYLNARMGNDQITSKVNGEEVIINGEDIRSALVIPHTLELVVSTHTFNQMNFLEEICGDNAPTYVKFSGKKKTLLKPIRERVIDIVYKLNVWNLKLLGLMTLPHKGLLCCTLF